ncbi:unnamed protein product [Prunus armeniaca]|uniref:Reverse transcriptase domain-containing protein n=1 Tax=Prunus armeniaca TaxID=36596 RepID=A0A6J5U1F0_PRUAR|nr:unnamed protein product [Prunus armeniaca]
MKNTKDLNAGKFGRSWEGPFEVIEAYGKDAYKLRRVETNPCRLQHYPEVTNPLGPVNLIHTDLNITQRSAILWEQSIRSMPIATLPRGYQSSKASQLDPCRSRHHPEVSNRIRANPSTTPRLSIL